MERTDEILKYWFGNVEDTVLPSPDRTRLWFDHDRKIDNEIKSLFEKDLNEAIVGDDTSWEDNPRNVLALIILFDQFSRRIYRDMSSAYAQDQRALDLCLRGIEKQYDHEISLIERTFFYFPLMHSENVEMLVTAVRAYKILFDLSFPEARGVFENFLDQALRRLDVIKRFGRFPQRNSILRRTSTEEELKFLESEYLNPEQPSGEKNV